MDATNQHDLATDRSHDWLLANALRAKEEAHAAERPSSLGEVQDLMSREAALNPPGQWHIMISYSQQSDRAARRGGRRVQIASTPSPFC